MPATTEAAVAAVELRSVLDLIRHRMGYRKLADVLMASGMPEATAYRRLKALTDLHLDELLAVATRYGIPLEVLVAGHRSTMRWMLDNPGPSDGDPVVVEYPPRDSNPEPAGSRNVAWLSRTLIAVPPRIRHKAA